jgi:ABC-type branched-subunit amino acid transport system ATPase component/ABC-type branched-subunit amino acid transport system permease subunit
MSAAYLVLGLLEGLLIGLSAVGLVLVYRSNRFLNLAHGQLGALSALLMGKFVLDWGWSYWIAFPACLAVGVVIGAGVDRFLVRRLRRRTASTITMLLLTLGISQILLSFTYLPVLKPSGARLLVDGYPLPFHTTLSVGGVRLGSQYLLVAILCPLIVLGLTLLLRYSLIGKLIRAAAGNPEAARLCGISPSLTSAVTWAIAGGLSAIAAILQAPATQGFDASSLGAQQLFLALGAAALGGFRSIPMALVGGIGLGLCDQITLGITSNGGTALLVVFLAVLATVFARGSLLASAFGTSGKPVDDLPPVRIPTVLRDRIYSKHPALLLGAGGLFVALLLPLLPPFSSEGHRFLLSVILIYTLVAIGLTTLIGWGGQLSLGHFGVVAVGAYVTARMSAHGYGVVPLALTAAVAGAVVMVLVALPALRVRGFALAVTSLGFGILVSQYLSRTQWFTASPSFARDVPPLRILPNSSANGSQLSVYYVALGVVVLLALASRQLRRSLPGKIMIAVRDDERASASYGVVPATVKLTVAAFSGALCGVAGFLWADAWKTVQPDQFPPAVSISLLALPVIGGLGSIGGAIAATALIYLPTSFLTPLLQDAFGSAIVRVLGDNGGAAFFTLALSGLGIVGFLLANPTGIAGTAHRLWQLFLDNTAAQLRAQRGEPEAAAVALRRPALEVRGAELSFGGVKALNCASLVVERGEIVGLIGANGAGKSTLINVVSGVYRPTSGRVLLDGADISSLAAEVRAAQGLGRTFQSAELFPGLTVRETLHAVIAAKRKVGALSSMVNAPWAVRTQRSIARQAEEIIERTGLGDYADTLTGALSTGTRRICALATQIAARPRVIVLDEPTAGVAQRETEQFGPLLRRIRDELDCAILIVEHDMPLLMGLCDRVYAMESGAVIAEGTPAQIRKDPRVVASYLGTDEAAINRSGAASTVRSRKRPTPPVLEATS